MSKIYEALRRAEQENATSNHPSNAKQRPFSLSSLETLQAEPASLERVSDQDRESYVPVLSFEDIAAYPWEPSLPQLPALEFRGAGVEQFRSLRSRLYEFRVLDKMKSILVTSGLPQEGKSYVAANLAISLARHRDNRVLLIDGDMRRPSQHKLLGCSSKPGLTEYLSGAASLQEVMQRPALDANHSQIAGLMSLAFVAAGSDCDKAGDLSLNRRFEELLRTVAPSFDWIIVDSSPVNLVSDAVNLARACHGVLLIARSGVTQLETAKEAAENLRSTKLIGCVLNASEEGSSARQYYGYNGYDPIKTDE